MMRAHILSAVFCLLAVLAAAATSVAQAQTEGLRDTDIRFDLKDLDMRLRGQTIVFFDDGESRFYEDGRYTYTYANEGGTGYGYFTVTEDSAVCISFVNGASRCDTYVTDADNRLVVITAAGDRFPVRP